VAGQAGSVGGARGSGTASGEGPPTASGASLPPLWRLLPLSAALGALGGFVLAVGRTEHRFVLAPGFWLSCYAGMAMATLAAVASHRRATARAARFVGIAALLGAARPPLALAATEWRDGRREVETWLCRLPPGTTVETYGPLVYLPRLDRLAGGPLRLTRVGPEPAPTRNPLAGVAEVEGLPDAIEDRRPDVVILTEGFAASHLPPSPETSGSGRVLPLVWQRERATGRTTELVREAVSGALPNYQLRLVTEPHLPPLLGPPRRVHASTGLRTWILVRKDRVASGEAGHSGGEAGQRREPQTQAAPDPARRGTGT